MSGKKGLSGAPKNYTPEIVLAAIKNSYGVVLNVAKKLQCDWRTAKTYIDKWEVTRQAFEDESETLLDLCETKAAQLVKEKDGPMIKWMLATKGKKRGYTEKQEIDHNVNTPVQIVIKGE